MVDHQLALLEPLRAGEPRAGRTWWSGWSLLPFRAGGDTDRRGDRISRGRTKGDGGQEAATSGEHAGACDEKRGQSGREPSQGRCDHRSKSSRSCKVMPIFNAALKSSIL